LGEGKKREIRRIVASLGAKTLRLKRIAVGNLLLGPLPAGKWRELTPEERDQALMTSASISE
jgi:16S rRNA U516 pseudouridylate synthase RsuA-like enzyme